MRKKTIIIVCMMLIPTFSSIYPINISVAYEPSNPGDIIVQIIRPKYGYLYIWDREIGPFPLFITTLVIGTITVEVYAAADNATGISRVEFYVDDVLMATKYIGVNNTYKWTWDKQGPFFPYRLGVKAYDLGGNSASTQMRVWKIF